MTNQISSDFSPKHTSLLRAIKKLPWSVFAVVLFIHLGVLWWLLGDYFGPTQEHYPEPIFVTLEALEPLDPVGEESSTDSGADGPAKADLYDTRPEGLR